MVRKMALAAAIGIFVTGSAAADGAGRDLNYGMLHWIRDTVCTPGREIVFVPVSHDARVRKRNQTWAVIGMDNPDPDTAHVVSNREKVWLKANGCDAEPMPRVQMVHQDMSAGLDL